MLVYKDTPFTTFQKATTYIRIYVEWLYMYFLSILENVFSRLDVWTFGRLDVELRKEYKDICEIGKRIRAKSPN